MSAYLPMAPELRRSPVTQNGMVVFMGNGTNDPVVKHPWAQWSKATLEHLGFDVRLESYK